MACLSTDFQNLPQKDQTIVGQKGVTLSGGQAARVALARCIYAQTDILLLDDPLSAVDSKVGKQMFHKCIRPLSQKKIVILSTHQIGFLHDCDEVILLDQGRITEKGTPGDVAQSLLALTENEKSEE